MDNINPSVSPGIGGFLAFFLLAIALWLLMRNMSTHLRSVRFDEESEDERRAAEAGDDVVTRPRRRQIFLPVADGRTDGAEGAEATPAEDGDAVVPGVDRRGQGRAPGDR